MGSLLIALAVAASPPTGAQPLPASVKITPATLAVFERDWVLMNWALKFYDGDRNGVLAPAEAEAAAVEFRKIADVDGDGRITPQEYRTAREFILARY